MDQQLYIPHPDFLLTIQNLRHTYRHKVEIWIMDDVDFKEPRCTDRGHLTELDECLREAHVSHVLLLKQPTVNRSTFVKYVVMAIGGRNDKLPP